MKYYFKEIKQNFIFSRLIDIKNKPELWLRKKSLSYLDCYISAYIDGYISDRTEESLVWFKEFKKYVCKICVEGNECYGPINAIFQCGYDEESGFDYYYELLDSFIQENVIGEDYIESKEESYLKDEVKVIRVKEDEIYQMAGKYIYEHKEEIFDLPEKKAEFISEYTLYQLFKGREIISAVYDSRYVNLTDVLQKMEID